MSIPANHPAIQEARRRGLIEGEIPSASRNPPATSCRVRLTLGLWLAGFLPPAERNQGGRFRLRLARKATQKRVIGEALARLTTVRLPVVVTFVRHTTAVMDDDNLRDSYKTSRDVIAAWLGCDDGEADKVVWEYRQERTRPTGTQVVIREAA